MFGYVYDRFVYIGCPKNGLMTYSTLLEKNGWAKINLFENDLNLDEYVIWAHITDPEHRHTRGVEQYLRMNQDLPMQDPLIAKMLVSGVFDEHTYSLNMMLGKYLKYNIHWIPLDVTINGLSGDDLTNLFFKEHKLDLEVTPADRLNVTVPYFRRVQNLIKQYKVTYKENYQKLVKNFLEPDILLYNKVVDQFRKKYE